MILRQPERIKVPIPRDEFHEIKGNPLAGRADFCIERQYHEKTVYIRISDRRASR